MLKLSPVQYRYLSEEDKLKIVEMTPRCNGELSERVYWINNNITDYPECPYCFEKLTSNNWIKNGKRGYRTFCSKSCAMKSKNYEESIEKRKQTNLEKYGTSSNPWYFPKFRQYLKNKYGIEHVETSQEN